MDSISLLLEEKVKWTSNFENVLDRIKNLDQTSQKLQKCKEVLKNLEFQYNKTSN
jgi:hypothetical protein